jgi:hypothetical protein
MVLEVIRERIIFFFETGDECGHGAFMACLVYDGAANATDDIPR